MFENRVLRRIYGPGRREAEEDHVMRNFVICTLQILLGRSSQGGWDGHVARMEEETNAYKIFCQKTRREETTLKT
jgi:hypothetical protein